MMTDLQQRWFILACICVVLAITLALSSALSGLGTRWGWWGFRTGFVVLKWTAYAEVFMGLISLIGCFFPAGGRSSQAFILFLISFAIALAVVSVPLRMWLAVRALPMIHDITTDTENPPQFTAVIPMRKDAANPVVYGGREVAEQQQKAYPYIRPLLVEAPPEKAFELALATARGMRWEIVSASPSEGLIEATDTTFWFGFKDDIVIRISTHDKGSRIDVRSLSRVGKSDVGANAERIRKFFRAWPAATPLADATHR